MKTKTHQHILDIILQKQRVRPTELVKELNISNVAIHKQLRKLLAEGVIRKIGTPPSVFYIANDSSQKTPLSQYFQQNLEDPVKTCIEQEYLYISPSGEILPGLIGFETWVRQIHQEPQFLQLAQEFAHTRKKANLLFTSEKWIDATQKMRATFPKEKDLNAVLYQDFYALPKFGKTKLGQLVLHAKQAQHQKLIEQLATIIHPTLKKITQHFQIDAVGFIPHSIPRKIPFLKELRTQLNLNIPEIRLVKAYSGELPVAQKSLSKIEERIQNARETIFLQDSDIPYQNILLIDDAVGSGATFVETAKKLKNHPQVKKVIGFAIVGSMKGFDIIQEA